MSTRRFSVDTDVAARAVRLPAIHSRTLVRGLLAWAVMLTAVVGLPRSGSLATVSADALQRAASAAGDFMNLRNASVAPTTLAQGAPAAAVPAANAAVAQAAVGGAVTAANAVAPLTTGTSPAAAEPATGPAPVNPSVGQTTPVVTNPAPIAGPQQPAAAAPVAAPVVAPVVAAPVAQPAPTTAPVAAPVSVALPAAAVAAPAAPRAYTVPAGAIRVTTSAEFIAALSRSAVADIVLADGTYDNSGPFVNGTGHHVYAARLGGAVLTAGMSIGGNWGQANGLVQGLAFNVSSSAKTMGTGIIQVWGNASGTRILDSTFNGNRAIGAGIFISSPSGVVVSRVQVRNFTSYGVYADTNSANRVLAVPVILEDLDVSGVSRAAPRSSNGTAEACVWLGNNGIVRRAKLRDCAWMGLWTGGGNTGAIHENLDIDYTPTGLYMEHFTTGSLFQRILIGRNVTMGMVCEWADPDWGGRPGCVDVVVQDSTFMSSQWGAFLDEGTTRTTIRRVKFIGQTKAAIYDAPGTIGDSFSDNDYSQIAGSAVAITNNR